VNSEIHAVKKQVTRGEENQEKLRDTFEFMCSEYERMEKNVITLQTAVIRIEDSVAAHDQKLDDIYLLLEKLELGEDIQQKRSDSKSTKGARRDNLFNVCTYSGYFRSFDILLCRPQQEKHSFDSLELQEIISSTFIHLTKDFGYRILKTMALTSFVQIGMEL
jgi:hypothetical protein